MLYFNFDIDIDKELFTYNPIYYLNTNINNKKMTIKERFKTSIAVFKTIKYMKRNKDYSYKIGREFCTIFCIIYNEFKKNDLFNIEDTYRVLQDINGFESMILSSILNKDINFQSYFSKCNLKLLQLKLSILTSFFRGYYINDMSLFSTNIMEPSNGSKYVVLYDNHYHYLLFIYNYLSTIHTNKSVSIILNNNEDKYSINEESDSLCYKLIFEKKEFEFIDSIRLLLNFLYNDVEDVMDTISREDKYLYSVFMSYKSNS
jgi:hypothetical protein